MAIFLLSLLGLATAFAFALTLLGLVAVLPWPRRTRSVDAAPTMGRPAPLVAGDAVTRVTPVSLPVETTNVPPVSVEFDGKPVEPVEPGALLNTLWEHLPHAECQSGECGGCKVRLLSGEVRWVREPIVAVDRTQFILPCSCEAVGPIRCATP